MMLPVIGVTADFDAAGGAAQDPHYFLRERYAAAVEGAGGIPIILPYVDAAEAVGQLLERLSGVMVTGGNFDIDPSYYGERCQVAPSTVKARRTHFEMEITRQALARNTALLGVCGGEQNLNVLLGGTLYQDIREQVPGAMNHERKQEAEPLHRVTVEPDTLLYRIVGAGVLRVNSSHHQAVKRLGSGLRINARSDDGVIEGIESVKHRFVLGVQWHPESTFETSPDGQRIFEAFIDAASRTVS